MREESEEIAGVNYFSNPTFEDNRGLFQKLFVMPKTSSHDFLVRETFMSISRFGTLRGMHMQTGPFANNRIISVTSGKVLDVVVDLRSGSSSFGKLSFRVLDASEVNTVSIPKYVAHGFQALETSTMHYISDQYYSMEYDLSINPKSLGFEWPVPNPQLSLRDDSAISLEEYLSNLPHE